MCRSLFETLVKFVRNWTIRSRVIDHFSHFRCRITGARECRLIAGGQYYAGNVAVTVSGRTCQAWASNSPHSHSFHTDSQFVDGSDEAAGNKCRNPDKNWHGGAWCFTTDPAKRSELCDIPLCLSECIPRYISFVEYIQMKQLKYLLSVLNAWPLLSVWAVA